MPSACGRLFAAGLVVFLLAGRLSALEIVAGDSGGDDVAVEAEVRAYLVWMVPKSRFRNGCGWMPGTSVRSNETGIQHAEVGVGLDVDVLVENERIVLRAWSLDTRQRGALHGVAIWEGTFYPSGWPVEQHLKVRRGTIGWRHRFQPLDNVRLEPGLLLELVHLETSVGLAHELVIDAVYPSLEVAVVVAPFEWIDPALDGFEVEGAIGGLFWIPFAYGDTAVVLPLQFRGALRYRAGGFQVEIAARLDHMQIENYPGETREDVAHVRFRDVSFGVGFRF